MSQRPFMQLWVSDFIGDTLDLDAKEIGAYMLLLMSMWQRDGTLPDDQKKLRRVARCGRDWPRVWDSISRYFEVENGVISNRRLTKEMQKVDTKRAVNAQHGALGGRAKALKNNESTLANATVSLKQPEPELDKEREAKASPKKKIGTRLSEDWALPQSWGDWALSEGWPDAVVRSESEKFKDFWISKSGRDATKVNWQATWRNWLRNCKSPKVINGGQSHGQLTSQNSPTLDAIAIAARSRTAQR